MHLASPWHEHTPPRRPDRPRAGPRRLRRDRHLAGRRRHRPEAAAAGAQADADPDRQHRAGQGLAGGRDADGRAGPAVHAFADGLDHPRWLYVLPNGDVLVAETNAPPRPDDGKGIKGWVMKLRDEAGRRRRAQRQPHHAAARRRRRRRGRDAHRRSWTGLNSPFGMALVGDDLYVANTDARRALPLRSRATTQITAPGDQGRRPARRADQPPLDQERHRQPATARKLYVTVGSNSNVGRERHGGGGGPRRDLGDRPRDRRSTRVFATGLRNPNGLAWEPGDRRAVDRRSTSATRLGSDLVPDYLTSVRDGGFYGWPYSYYGQHVDDARAAAAARPGGQGASCPTTRSGRTPRSLGLAFAPGDALPARLRQRRLHRPARLVEPQAAQRLQGDLRAVRGRQARRRRRSTC